MENGMLRALWFCFAFWLGCGAATAQQWPTRSIHLIVPYAAGGGTDIVARVVAQRLGGIFGEQFVVENRSGASGMIGAAAVAKASPDGYTLLVASPAEIALNQNLFKNMSYDPLKELVPITLLAWTPLVLAAHPSLAASTPQQLIELARREPVYFSSPGIGSSQHLTGEYIGALQNIPLVHVPYRGGAPAVTDAVSGQVKLTIAGLPPVVPFLKEGVLKAIAVTSKRRSPQFPDIPAMSEISGFEDFDFTNWFGLLAPAGTPAAILDRLQKASVEALKDEQVRAILASQAAVGVGNTSDEFRDFIRAEAEKYAKIVAVAHLQPQ
jgi:tripartite-type tricarboxylate transporter receptor subunit TctC